MSQREEEKFTVYVKLPDSWKHCRLKPLKSEKENSGTEVRSLSQLHERIMIRRLDEWYTEEIPVSMCDIVISSSSNAGVHTSRIHVSPESNWVTINEDLSFVVQSGKGDF